MLWLALASLLHLPPIPAAPPRPLVAEDSVLHIVMVREACPGQCPVYGIRLDRDGTVVYQGQQNVKRQGTFTGRITRRQFLRLEQLAQNARFLELRSEYLVNSDRFPVTTTTLVHSKGHREIRSHSSGPIAIAPTLLRHLQDAIDALVEEVQWSRVGEAPAAEQ